jgi:hypothetical protein
MTKILWQARPIKSISRVYYEDDGIEITIEDLKSNGLLLKEIINQTEEQCLAAVKNNANALIYSKHTTEPILLAAVKQKGSMLRYIKDPNNKICIAALNQDPNILEYIKHQTEEMILIAVKKSAFATILIKKPSPDIYKKIINVNLDSHQYMDDKYVDHEFMNQIWIKLLNNNGLLLEKCIKKTVMLCEYAIKQNPHAVKFIDLSIVNAQNDYMYLLELAIKNNPHTIQYIFSSLKGLFNIYEYIKLVQLAVSINGLTINYVPDFRCFSYEIYKLAVEQNKEALPLIKNKYYRYVLNDELYVKSNKALEDCLICYSSDEYFIKKFKCSHLYCRDCIQNELIQKCPMCRESRKETSLILIKK